MSPTVSDQTDRQTCIDCSAPLAGRYCSACGQRGEVGPLRWRHIAREVVDSIISLNAPVLRTTIDLLWRPGEVASDWIAGRRRTYTNPVQYCLLAGVIAAVLSPLIRSMLIADDAAGTQLMIGSSTTHGISAEVMTRIITDYLAFVALVLVIPLAAIMSVLSSAGGLRRNWLEWYVLGVYVFAICVVLQMAAGLLVAIAPTISGLAGVFPLLGFTYGAWGFVDREKRVRALLLAVTALVLWLGVMVLAALAVQLVLGSL